MNQKSIVILDVRTPEEYSQGHLKGSQNLDFFDPNFQKKISSLNKENDYKLYCRSGNRSGQAATMMKQLGFKLAENLGSLEQASQIMKIEIVL